MAEQTGKAKNLCESEMQITILGQGKEKEGLAFLLNDFLFFHFFLVLIIECDHVMHPMSTFHGRIHRMNRSFRILNKIFLDNQNFLDSVRYHRSCGADSQHEY